MKLTGTPDEILAQIEVSCPEVREKLAQARATVPYYKREIYEYQAAALYMVAKAFNYRGAKILEIGTAWGYSAAVMALAAPLATIITLNPVVEEVEKARKNLFEFPNVKVEIAKSWELFATYKGDAFDLIFNDGDHKRVKADFVWWDKLKPNGLYFFHDYSAVGMKRECPPVFEGVNELTSQKGFKEPHVLIVDDGGCGMAGLYKVEDATSIKEDATRNRMMGITAGYTILTTSHLEQLYTVASGVADLSGSIVEAGCGNGGALAAAWMGAKRKKNPHRREVWGFDTFRGIPEPDYIDGGKVMSKWTANKPWCPAEEDAVYEVMARVKVPKDMIYICAGDFADTMKEFDPGDIAFLHIDATLYRSTKTALNALYPKVLVGGIVTISAYHHWGGVRAAVDEFFKERGLNPTVANLDTTNIYWKK